MLHSRPVSALAASIALAGALSLSGCVAAAPSSATAPTQSPSPTASISQADALDASDASACEDLVLPISLASNVGYAPEGELGAKTKSGLFFSAEWDLSEIREDLDDASVLAGPVERMQQAANSLHLEYQQAADPERIADQLREFETAWGEAAQRCTRLDEHWGTLGWYGG